MSVRRSVQLRSSPTRMRSIVTTTWRSSPPPGTRSLVARSAHDEPETLDSIAPEETHSLTGAARGGQTLKRWCDRKACVWAPGGARGTCLHSVDPGGELRHRPLAFTRVVNLRVCQSRDWQSEGLRGHRNRVGRRLHSRKLRFSCSIHGRTVSARWNLFLGDGRTVRDSRFFGQIDGRTVTFFEFRVGSDGQIVRFLEFSAKVTVEPSLW